MKKTLFIAVCVFAMLFAFTACEENKGIDDADNYADNAFAADLAESIYAKGAAESLVAAANEQGNDVDGLTISFNAVDFEGPFSSTPAPISIKVDVTVSGEYKKGFHQDTHDFRSLIDGAGTVTVNGQISKEADVITFVADNYTAFTTDDVVIKDAEGEYKGVHTFKVTKIEGEADGNIKLESEKFTTDGMTLTLPTADKVEVYLDGKPVDYNTLCSTVGVKPGEYEITFLPDSTN